jgi:hypothetical protein
MEPILRQDPAPSRPLTDGIQPSRSSAATQHTVARIPANASAALRVRQGPRTVGSRPDARGARGQPAGRVPGPPARSPRAIRRGLADWPETVETHYAARTCPWSDTVNLKRWHPGPTRADPLSRRGADRPARQHRHPRSRRPADRQATGPPHVRRPAGARPPPSRWPAHPLVGAGAALPGPVRCRRPPPRLTPITASA